MERLSVHELANNIKATPVENKNGYRDLGIQTMISLADNPNTRKRLNNSTFEETEDGYVSVCPIDTAEDWDSVKIGEVHSYYTDANGYKVRLGAIRGSWRKGPSAEVNVSPDKAEALDPSDERWDAVVGVIGRAIVAHTVAMNK